MMGSFKESISIPHALGLWRSRYTWKGCKKVCDGIVKAQPCLERVLRLSWRGESQLAHSGDPAAKDPFTDPGMRHPGARHGGYTCCGWLGMLGSTSH